MKKRPVTILAVVMAWLLFASTALAVVTIEADAVYANGHAITVVRDDTTGDTRVTSDDAEAGLAGNTTNVAGRDIYGGSKNGDVSGNTSVTINGGTTGDVYGGGLNGDVNGSTNVVVNGGTTGDVYGGGHAVGENGGTADHDGEDGDADVTGSTTVTVNGGTTGDVYGGGHAEGGDADGRNINDDISGGNADATVEDNTNVTIAGGSTGNVYGGGHAEGGDADGRNNNDYVSGGDAKAVVQDNTNVKVAGGTVNGNVYGSGRGDSGEVQGSGTDDGYADAYVEDNATVTISGGTVTGIVTSGGNTVDGDSDSWTRAYDSNTVIIEGGNIQGKKVYVESGDWATDYLIIKHPSALYYTYYIADAFNFYWSIQNNIVDDYTFGVIDHRDGYHVYGFANVPQPKVKTATFIYKYGTTEVFRETKSVTMNFWDSDVTLTSNWPGNENLNTASGTKTMSYCGADSETVNIAVTPKTKTGTVTFNYVYGGVTYFTEQKTGTVTYGAGEITLNSTWGGNANVNGASGSGKVSYAAPTTVVNIAVTPKTKTGTVTFNYVYGGVTHFTEQKTGTVTYGAGEITLNSIWGGNANVNGGNGSGTVSFAAPTNVVNITVTPKTTIGTVTFNYVYGGVTHFTEQKTGTVTYGAGEITLTSIWGGNANVNGGNGSGKVSFAAPTKTVEIAVAPKTKTGTVTFNYVYGGVTHFTEQKTGTVTYGAGEIKLTSTWGGNENVGGGGGEGSVSFAEPTRTVEIAVGPKTKTGTVTFNYVYGGVTHFTEQKTGTVTYGAGEITLSSDWSGNENVNGGSGEGSVSFAAPTNVVNITVTPKTKTGTVTFNYVYGGVTHFTEDKTATVTYGAEAVTLSSDWSGNDNVYGGSGEGSVSFAAPTNVVNITVTPKTKTGTVTFNYVYGGVTHFTEQKTGTVTYGAGEITLSSDWSGNENVNGGSGEGSVSFEAPTNVVNITVTPKTKTGTVTFNYVYGGVTHFTEDKTATVTYGAEAVTLSSDWSGNDNVYGGSGEGTVSFAEPAKTITITVEPKSKVASVTFNYVFGEVTYFTETKTADVTYGAQAITLSSTWGGNDNVNGGSGEGTVSFAEPTNTVTITVTPKTKTGTVTFNYVYGGVTHYTETKTVDVAFGAQPVAVNSTWDGDANVNGGSGTGTVSFAEPTDIVTITVTPKSRTMLVRFNYLYNGAVISSDEQSVTLTYGEADKTVTPAPFAVAGYYLLAPVSPVSVNYSMALEVEVIEIEALLGIVDDGDDTPQIPLGPGAPGTPIPLGVGVPSTGDRTGFSILLMAIGVAVVAFVTAVTKRSSAK